MVSHLPDASGPPALFELEGNSTAALRSIAIMGKLMMHINTYNDYLPFLP
jgi:hypothetical protein